MPNVTVTPPNSINIRVNQDTQKSVRGTTTFVGAAVVQDLVNQAVSQSAAAFSVANSAYTLAQDAYNTANTKFDKTGGTISGSVIITNNLDVNNVITASSEIIDAGTF